MFAAKSLISLDAEIAEPIVPLPSEPFLPFPVASHDGHDGHVPRRKSAAANSKSSMLSLQRMWSCAAEAEVSEVSGAF